MTPIPFRTNPAFVSLGDALELMVAHLRANLVLWAVPTLIYTLVVGALSYAFAERFIGLMSTFARDPRPREEAARAMLQQFAEHLPALMGLGLLMILGGVALYWIGMALAVGGLPGRRMTPDVAIGAGLKTIVLGILLVVALSLVLLVGVLLLGVIGTAVFSRAGGASVLLFLVLFPASIVVYAYVAARLSFAPYAIFDGVGIIDSLRVSWSISRGGVLRIVGWLAALLGLSFAVSIGGNIASASFSSTLPIVGMLISIALTTILQFVQPVVLAVLYESQRMRYVFSTPAAPGLAGGPIRTLAPAAPVDPLQPPPPPAW